MELIKKEGFLVTYQRQGNDRNGNPIYILNFFDDEKLYSVNYKADIKKDKYGNIKCTSYCINDYIDYIIIDNLKNQ
jgi:hypothetical protein